MVISVAATSVFEFSFKPARENWLSISVIHAVSRYIVRYKLKFTLNCFIKES